MEIYCGESQVTEERRLMTRIPISSDMTESKGKSRGEWSERLFVAKRVQQGRADCFDRVVSAPGPGMP